MNSTDKKYKVVAAMSGGVDSSVAAAVCKRRDWEVVGATLRLKSPDPEFARVQTCASKSDEDTVKEVCEMLGIEHHFLDLYPEFEQHVLRPAWDDYRQGRTPNPCTFCNQIIKFGKLLKFANDIGADAIVTGHYARIVNKDGVFKLQRGSDPRKDQTYFLYRLTQKQLSKIHFPIGEMRKTEVREFARELGLQNSDKKDSQDACFCVDGEPFPETLRRLFEGERTVGDFVHEDRIVGKHSGLHQYTIGQRKGLGVALGKPGYVQSIDPESGSVRLTTDENGLMSESFEVTKVNWQCGDVPKLPQHYQIQIRYRSAPGGGLVNSVESSGDVKVLLDEPRRAITQGQAAVFYDGEFLIGGGVIK
ncbi:MAG: tRNA 2-thiouridine(34) synthase MnmA [Lentisphaerae bacterium]|nr:tRNA 2-thiouridine(34) synthase MnmA [Lentisphaerota bacterium]MCP4102065.1 tRNA 2-thiouridine(34) synthase MnmA [Lentisphaerota bacterium]